LSGLPVRSLHTEQGFAIAVAAAFPARPSVQLINHGPSVIPSRP
jgi:hypothetical protein